jgi:serine/threonine-protein kinase
MSPEQARGLKTIDHRTDLYSLGLVAYTMLTGNLAFSSESFGDLLLQICTAPLPSLRANAPWLPPATETWFMRACAREPQDRFATAHEFGEALKAACEGAVNASSVPGLAQSNPGAIGYGQTTAAPSIGSPGAAASAAATASGMSRSGVGTDAISTPKSKAPVIAVLAAVLVVGGAAIAVLTLSKKDVVPPAPATTTPTVTQTTGAPTAHVMPTATLAEPASTIALVPDAGHGGESHEGAPPVGGTMAGGAAGFHPGAGNVGSGSSGHGVAPANGGGTHPVVTHPTTAATGGAIDLGY